MIHFLKFLAIGSIALVASLGLYFVILAWNGPALTPSAGNIAAPINAGAIEQTKVGDLNLVGKLDVAGDFASGRFCLAGKCCATWEECFGAPMCSCTSWLNSGCSTGYDGCDISEFRQTRSCNPAGCDLEIRCVADDDCISEDPDPCEHYTCEDPEDGTPNTCGYISDGCGQIINCGTCADDEECIEGNCRPNNCDPCAGNVCGTVPNACTDSGTVDCGNCSTGEMCQNHYCEPIPF